MVAAAVRVLLPNKQTDGQTDRQTDICDSKVELATCGGQVGRQH